MQVRTQRGSLVTLVERQTRLTLAVPLPSKRAEETARRLAGIFAALPAATRRSITFENGSEFAQHQDLKDKLDMDSFFYDPHSPWQRGAVENANGILRRDLPRKTELQDYSEWDIHDIVWAINTTPRKCLGYLTPAEAFLHQLRRCT